MNKKGQAFVEFILIAPVILFILLGIVGITNVMLDKQKLEMASYYSARLYAKYSIRGVKHGSIYSYWDKKDRILAEIIAPRVKNFLGRDDIEITNPIGNQVKLSMPSGISFGIDGIGGINKDYILTATGEMENDTLQYGGGRSGEDVLGTSA